jgi:hypothetical protein
MENGEWEKGQSKSEKDIVNKAGNSRGRGGQRHKLLEWDAVLRSYTLVNYIMARRRCPVG